MYFLTAKEKSVFNVLKYFFLFVDFDMLIKCIVCGRPVRLLFQQGGGVVQKS